MKLLRLVSLVLFFYSCNAQPKQAKLETNKDENSLLWEVSGNGLKNSTYLFGTFHLMCKEDIKFSKQLQLALDNANEIYMEMDMDDPATLLGGLFLMNMKGDKKLKDLYTEEEYKKIEHYFKDSLHTPILLLQKTKPYFLAAMLYPKMLPCKTTSGIEEELLKLAKEKKKEIKGLETIAFQASVFDSIPYEEQAKELLQSIDSMKTNQLSFDSMVNVYKSQQLAKMEKLLSKEDLGMNEHQDILLNNRNKNWVVQLKTIMPKEAVFVAVGAGHLLGEKGLISLLKKEGYTLRPLRNK